MTDANRLAPTPERRAALERRLTWAPRAVGKVFTLVGGAGAILTVVLAFVSPTLGAQDIVVMGLAFAGAPVVFALILRSVGRRRAKRLLRGTLARGRGTITEVRSPGSDGGPTRLRLALTLPEGGAAEGLLNTYHLQTAKSGDVLSLWFAQDGSSFFLADSDVNSDPGRVQRT